MLFPGNPIPLSRPRFSIQRVYDSQKNLKLITGMHVVQQHDNEPFLIGPLHLEVTFYMPIPKFRLKKIKNGQSHISVPDLDNLIKWICDVCLNVIYKDDSIVTSINAKKIYDVNARTEFQFTQIGG